MRNPRLAIRLIVVTVVLFAVKPSGVRAQTPLAITVTNTPTAITTNTSAAYFILVENSSNPSALWSVSVVVNGVTQSPVYEPAGAQFVFTSRSTRYAAGTLLVDSATDIADELLPWSGMQVAIQSFHSDRSNKPKHCSTFR